MTGNLGTRILIVGCPGSGKSTLARKLGERSGLALIHLDNIWWKPDRTHVSREEFDRALKAILSTDGWIIDGNYRRTYEMRIVACTGVIFMDLPEQQCLRGITERIGQARPDIPWTEDSLDPELVAMVRNFGRDNRPLLLSLLAAHPDKPVITLRSRAEADAWLESLGNGFRVFPADTARDSP